MFSWLLLLVAATGLSTGEFIALDSFICSSGTLDGQILEMRASKLGSCLRDLHQQTKQILTLVCLVKHLITCLKSYTVNDF